MGRFSSAAGISSRRRLLALNRKGGASSGGAYRKPAAMCSSTPKTGAPYQLHEFYYLHKRILKQAGLPWVAFRNLQRQCMEVGYDAERCPPLAGGLRQEPEPPDHLCRPRISLQEPHPPQAGRDPSGGTDRRAGGHFLEERSASAVTARKAPNTQGWASIPCGTSTGFSNNVWTRQSGRG